MRMDGAIVATEWLSREVVSRRCTNIAQSLASVAESEALLWFREALGVAVGRIEPSMLAAAREALTPVDTVLVIEAAGREDAASIPGEPVKLAPSSCLEEEVAVVLPAATTLVLFEYLCREVDDRDGRNLLASFVGPSEYWALMGTQCSLEPGEFYAIDRDYPQQVKEARAWLCASAAGGDLMDIEPGGNEDL